MASETISSAAVLGRGPFRIRIHEPLPWRVEEDKQSGGYVATSDLLNLTTQGETFGEVLEMISDVTDLLFRSLRETNELEAFFGERKLHSSPLPPTREDTFNMRVVDARTPVSFAGA
jgi:predicted RNase H-like HicB family nuclease